jgi:hypothetical protein
MVGFSRLVAYTVVHESMIGILLQYPPSGNGNVKIVPIKLILKQSLRWDLRAKAFPSAPTARNFARLPGKGEI